MATGFRKALDSNLDIVVKLDGDGQMDPAFMIELIEPIIQGVCDYAKGNRFLHIQALRRMPVMRKLGNVALTFLTKITSGYWHTFDPQNGYVAIRADYLGALGLRRLRTRRYFFENEMLIQLNAETARVLDCPMPSIYGNEVSSLKISHILLYFPFFLVRGFFSRLLNRYILRDFSIVIPLYLLGAISSVFGACFGAYRWYLAIQPDAKPTTAGTIMISVLPLILGFQMLLQGLLIDILQTPQAERPTWRHGDR
jgi:glycosyltransferase involved in cell wall biosynthesis